MPMEQSDYAVIRDQIRVGDVIAFAGDSLLSRMIRVAGGANVSHVGIVLEAATPTHDVLVAESTVDLGQPKPVLTVSNWPLGKRIEQYDGRAWWLALDGAVRAALDVPGLVQFVRDAHGQPFDVRGGLEVVLRDLWQRLLGMESRKDLEAYFCSELVARALEEGGVVPPLDASEVSPGDLCRWDLYEADYHYVQKPHYAAQEIRGYNTRPRGST